MPRWRSFPIHATSRPLDQPERFNEIVAEFLRAHS